MGVSTILRIHNKIMNKPYKTTCLINDTEQEYHACSKGSLKEAKEFYKDFTYIGSGIIYKINGFIQKGEDTYHFFIKND